MDQQSRPITTIKDFTIIGKLGEGSFSQVFKVKRISDQQEYAMKRVRMGQLKAKERENALNEIRILASLDDPYIVGYKEAFFEDEGSLLCIIMEYAGAGDIQRQVTEHIKSGKCIDESEIWKALIHITLGLRSLHRIGILHRDLKCANIFRSRNGTYKLGDLNVSKVSNEGLAKTQTGTPYYAAPEVWKDQPYSVSADIWSLGCVIYEMAALKPPFRAADLRTLFKKVLNGVYDPLPKVYSKDLTTMLQLLLKVAPNMRPTCDQILQNEIIKARSDGLIERIIKEEEQKQKAQLLQTIKVPKQLNLLKGNLPEAKYQGNEVPKKVEPPSPSVCTVKTQVTRATSAGSRRPDQYPKTPVPSTKGVKPPVVAKVNARDNGKPDIPLAPKKLNKKQQQPNKAGPVRPESQQSQPNPKQVAGKPQMVQVQRVRPSSAQSRLR